jgi:FMN reductase
VQAIVDAFAAVLPSESHVIRLQELGPHLGGALTRADLPAEAEAELQRIEGADLLVVATPVYRASFTGLFKYVFDFVDQYALVDTPVLLAATGGSERHALIIEHQLRPLFSFFQSLALPVGVYAHDSDFTDYRVSNEQLTERIDKAISRALPLVRSSLAEREQIERTLAGEEPTD